MSKRKIIEEEFPAGSFPARKTYAIPTLPKKCKDSVSEHFNTIYTNSILRVFDKSGEYTGQLCRAHVRTTHGIYCSILSKKRCESIDIRNMTWVVDNSEVCVRSQVLWHRTGTNDIENELKPLTMNEKRQISHKRLLNDIMMKWPTKKDQASFDCLKYALTCNCGYSLKVKPYTCSMDNENNAGRTYYGCCNKFIGNSCNFFVWESDIDHGFYRKCHCGKLAKMINIKSKDPSVNPVYKFVCINGKNQSDRLGKGCSMFEDF